MVVFKETAEEQLLRMIEGSSPPGQAPKAPPLGSPLSPWARIKGRFARWASRGPKRASADPFLSNLQTASLLLWLILAGLGIYLGVDLVWIRPVFKPAPVSQSPPGSQLAQDASSEIRKNPLKTLSEYMAAVVHRNPFITPGSMVLPQQQAVQSAQARLEEMVKDLVIVGIDRGPNPVALVESTKENRTFILNTGDEIHGMKVKGITAEGVLLTYEGQEVLLR